MEQIEALRKLAAKVEAGGLAIKPDAHILAGYIGFEPQHASYLIRAYSGSLDAAHALHKAVLGDGWLFDLAIRQSGKTVATIDEWRGVRCRSSYAANDTPARAWLLAIIKAKIQELEND